MVTGSDNARERWRRLAIRVWLRRASILCTAGVLQQLLVTSAAAHGGPQHRRVTWSDWNWDPVAVIVLLSVAWLYARGVVRLWQQSGRGRGIRTWQAGCFAAGWFVAMLTIVSPLDPLSDQLGAAHMVQHMALMTVAAPLLVLGVPLYGLTWGLELHWRKQWAIARRRLQTVGFLFAWLWQPFVVWGIYFAALWGWHWPPAYETALRSPAIHDAQHATFFVASILFWRLLLDPLSRHKLTTGPAMVVLFTTTMHATLLGVFMTLAPAVWYSSYEGRTAMWGYSALEDQQLAGLIMWMPACLGYLIAAVWLLTLVLSTEEMTNKRGTTRISWQLSAGGER